MTPSENHAATPADAAANSAKALRLRIYGFN